MQTYPEAILNQPIQQLNLSQEFNGIAEILGFYTLADLLQLHTRDLIKLPGFTYPLLYEYINFIEHKDLGHYIDPV